MVAFWSDEETKELQKQFTKTHRLKLLQTTHANGDFGTEWWGKGVVQAAFTPFPGTIIVENTAFADRE